MTSEMRLSDSYNTLLQLQPLHRSHAWRGKSCFQQAFCMPRQTASSLAQRTKGPTTAVNASTPAPSFAKAPLSALPAQRILQRWQIPGGQLLAAVAGARTAPSPLHPKQAALALPAPCSVAHPMGSGGKSCTAPCSDTARLRGGVGCKP